MQKFRLGLVGAGLICESSHLPAALASTQVSVAAIVDPVQNRAAVLARKFGIKPLIATEVREIAGAIDGAIIATPNHTHCELAVRCLNAGISVLIEKPLAGSLSEGATILEAGERNGKTIAIGYCTRFRPSTLLLKQLLDQDFFGKVTAFYHQYGTAGGWAPLSGYNLNRTTAGGGVLMVSATHFLDRMLNYWGYPDGARLADDGEGGPEANAVASFYYERGAKSIEGKARYSKTTSLRGGLVLDTEAGIVTLGDNDEAEITLRSKRFPELHEVIRGREPAPQRDVFLLQLEDFVAACRGEKEPQVTGHQGQESLRLLDTLYRERRPLVDRWYGERAEASWANA